MKLFKFVLPFTLALCLGMCAFFVTSAICTRSYSSLVLASVPVVSASAAAEKWARRAAGATQDYTNGVANPATDWATAAKAGESNYKNAVITAANAGKYGKGVGAAGTEKWKKNATEKGGARWAPGISGATDAFTAGISKVLSTVAALTLPPRGVKGDPANLQRVTLVANALHALKTKA